MTCTIRIMPRVRRPRRRAPVLELLAATLPELRRGLTGVGGPDGRLRAVREDRLRRRRRDRYAARARLRGGGRRPSRRRRAPDQARLRGARAEATAARAARAAHRVRTRGVPARCRRRGAARLSRTGLPGRSSPMPPTARRSTRRRCRRSTRWATSCRLSCSSPSLRTATATALQAQIEPHFVVQRAQHDRVVHPHRPGARATARACLRRRPAGTVRTSRRVRDARGRARPRSELPGARTGAIRHRRST